jgi:hypothetical protein
MENMEYFVVFNQIIFENFEYPSLYSQNDKFIKLSIFFIIIKDKIVF